MLFLFHPTFSSHSKVHMIRKLQICPIEYLRQDDVDSQSWLIEKVKQNDFVEGQDKVFIQEHAFSLRNLQ